MDGGLPQALAAMRASAAEARAEASRTAADLRRLRAETERAHRADPAYGSAARERRRRGPSAAPP